MYVIRGRLTPEASALLMRAVEAAGDALYREEHVPGVPESEGAVARRRADAMGLLTERTTAAGFRRERGPDGTLQRTSVDRCG